MNDRAAIILHVDPSATACPKTGGPTVIRLTGVERIPVGSAVTDPVTAEPSVYEQR